MRERIDKRAAWRARISIGMAQYAARG